MVGQIRGRQPLIFVLNSLLMQKIIVSMVVVVDMTQNVGIGPGREAVV